MPSKEITIDDRTQVRFMLGNFEITVCIRKGCLRVRGDGGISITPVAANGVDISKVE